jgi:exodeoxyribonuclease V alpha subunit
VVNVPNQVIYDAGKVKGLIAYDPRRAVELAYVITTHKAQGSEYNNVVYMLNKSNFMMQCRPNFYTAVTRAKDCACVITDQQSLRNSVNREYNIMEQRKR